MSNTIQVSIAIDAENPSGYAGDDTTFYVDCPKDKIDQFLVRATEVVLEVIRSHGLEAYDYKE